MAIMFLFDNIVMNSIYLKHIWNLPATNTTYEEEEEEEEEDDDDDEDKNREKALPCPPEHLIYLLKLAHMAGAFLPSTYNK